MMDWIPYDKTKHDCSPHGDYAFVADGKSVVPRSRRSGNPAADAFEEHFLRWLVKTYRAHPIAWASAFATFWRFNHKRRSISVGVVAPGKNTSTPSSSGVEWILRVEERTPLQFTPLLGQHFTTPRATPRKMGTDRIRTQFTSTELLPESEINRSEQ